MNIYKITDDRQTILLIHSGDGLSASDWARGAFPMSFPFGVQPITTEQALEIKTNDPSIPVRTGDGDRGEIREVLEHLGELEP